MKTPILVSTPLLVTALLIAATLNIYEDKGGRAVIRSGRWAKSGAARAVGKQLAKDLATLEKTGGLNAICQN